MNKLFFVFFLFCSTLFAEDKVTLCGACHGSKGVSSQSEWPNIAGQNTTYFIKQLKDMQRGSRPAGVMAGMVGTLSLQEIGDLAAYYAKMPPAQGTTPKQFVQRGEQLYRGGDLSKHITACIACHGPKGTGNAPAGFPLIAGQHAQYTILQLNAFKNETRSNDLNHIMQDITSRMSEEDIKAVAHYIEGLY